MAIEIYDLKALLTTFVTQILIAAGLVAFFSVLRPANRVVYEPRTKYLPEEKKPPALGTKYFEWLEVVRVDDLEQVDRLGLDAVMFLRFSLFLANYFTYCLYIAIPLMLVHFFSAPASNGEVLTFLTMFHMPPTSPLFWLDTVAAYAQSFIFYCTDFSHSGMMYQLWKEYITLKKSYFKSAEFQNSVNNRTLLLTLLQPPLQDRDVIRSFIKSQNVPYEPTSILLGRDFEELPNLCEEHLETVIKLEKVLSKYLKYPENLPRNRPTHRENATLGCFGGEKVGSIDFYAQKLHMLEASIYSLRLRGNEYFLTTSAAFVAFEKVSQAHESAKMISENVLKRVQNYLGPNVQISPQFDDILWENIAIDPNTAWVRRIAAMVMTAGLIIGWTFLMAFISTLNNLERFKNIPGIGQYLVRNPATSVFIQSFFVPILTIVVNLVLPLFLRMLTKFQGVFTKSGVEMSTLFKFYLFLVWQFIVVIGAGVIQTLIINFFTAKKGEDLSPEQFLLLLASGFVQNSVYYMIVSVSGFAGFSLEIIQAAVFFYRFLKRWMQFTPRQEREAQQAPEMDSMATYGILIYTFFNTAAYSVVAPLIVVIASMFFWLVLIVYKYQLYYVYQTKLETHGDWFPKVFSLLCLSIAMSQLTTFGSLVIVSAIPSTNLGVENGKLQSMLVGLLAAVTAVYWFWITRYIAPAGEYAAKQLADIEMNEGDVSPASNSERDVLGSRVFNPCVVQPLAKVWVKDDANYRLTEIYDPQYKDLVDYVKKTNPGAVSRANHRMHQQNWHVGTIVRKEQMSDASLPPEYEDILHRPSY